MLEIRVHHADPGRARNGNSPGNRATKSAGALFGSAVLKHDWMEGIPLYGGDDLRRVISAVIDEQDLDVEVLGRRLQSLDKLTDVARFVSRRDDHGEDRPIRSGQASSPRGRGQAG